MRKATIIRLLKKVAWTLGLIGFLVILGAAGKETLKRPLAASARIQVDYENDLYFVKEDEVAAVLQETLPRGLANYQLHEIDLTTIEKNVEALPYVRKAEASTDVNGLLTISIQQREPVARVINRIGVSYYLDQWGEKIPVTNNFTSRVPVITGAFTDNGLTTGKIESDELWNALSLLLFAREDSFFEALLEQVYISEKGEFELVPKVERHKILIGEADNWKEKLERVRLFYQKGLPKAGWKNYSTIDVRFDHQIVCKR